MNRRAITSTSERRGASGRPPGVDTEVEQRTYESRASGLEEAGRARSCVSRRALLGGAAGLAALALVPREPRARASVGALVFNGAAPVFQGSGANVLVLLVDSDTLEPLEVVHPSALVHPYQRRAFARFKARLAP